jgi:hypothetical protein
LFVLIICRYELPVLDFLLRPEEKAPIANTAKEIKNISAEMKSQRESAQVRINLSNNHRDGNSICCAICVLQLQRPKNVQDEPLLLATVELGSEVLKKAFYLEPRAVTLDHCSFSSTPKAVVNANIDLTLV